MKRILVSAFACLPPSKAGEGAGEAQLGFNTAKVVSKKYEVTVITDSENKMHLEEYDFCNFVYVRVPFLTFLKKISYGIQLYYYLWQIFAYKTARRLQKKRNFDLVHHVTYANGWIPSYIGAFTKTPFIWGPLGGGQRTPFAFYARYPLKYFVQEILRSGIQAVLSMDPVNMRCKKNAREIFVCNDETRMRFFRKQHNKVRYFPVTALTDEELQVLCGKNKKIGKTFRVLLAGRMIPLKGMDLGVKAFARFSKEYGDAELIIVGKGPEKKKLMKLANRYKIKASFFPWLEKPDLFALMKRCDVFLFPSLRDGGGAVAIEAMAAGMPIVCFTIGGPNVIVTESSGVKITPKTIKQATNDLAKVLKALKEDPQRLRMLSQGARKRATDFSWGIVSEDMIDAYGRVLGDGLKAR